jgi:DNA-directed RNA polymerase III subunit RPC8
LKGVGLCVSLWDIVKAAPQGQVLPGDAGCYFEIIFRLLVFRPRPREIFSARVVAIDEVTLRLSIDFFEDIYLPIANVGDHTVL